MWQNMLTCYISHLPHVRLLDQGAKSFILKFKMQKLQICKIYGVKCAISPKKLKRNELVSFKRS
jgi:hypothetical protein